MGVMSQKMPFIHILFLKCRFSNSATLLSYNLSSARRAVFVYLQLNRTVELEPGVGAQTILNGWSRSRAQIF